MTDAGGRPTSADVQQQHADGTDKMDFVLDRAAMNYVESGGYEADQRRTRQRQWRERSDNRPDAVAERRRFQQNENVEIGDGEDQAPVGVVDIVTLNDALRRFVFVSEGSRVSDRLNPRADLALPDFRNTYAASKQLISREARLPVTKLVADLWKEDEARVTVSTRTFRPDAEEICLDPNSAPSFNSWRPRNRATTNIDPALAMPFRDHVQFLFGQEAEVFLDWLAHIEQKPGILPHTAWLHIATKTGLGRNWIASVLARVWAGNVAANVDLPALLEGRFNGHLSAKYLAIVDEIREGGSDQSWRSSERLKSMITEETRLINPKFGRQSVEFNVCRWLLFSNHRSALKLTDTDRRINVSICECEPKPPEYYQKLYDLLATPEFIEAVAVMLKERDISQFNPGARSVMNEAKAEVVATSKSEWQHLAEMLRDHWPADVITAEQLKSVFEDAANNSALRHILEDVGIRPRGVVKLNGKATRVTVVRNHEKWRTAGGANIDLHLAGKLPRELESGHIGCREYLVAQAAESEERRIAGRGEG